jgi:hypothetical protein
LLFINKIFNSKRDVLRLFEPLITPLGTAPTRAKTLLPESERYFANLHLFEQVQQRCNKGANEVQPKKDRYYRYYLFIYY